VQLQTLKFVFSKMDMSISLQRVESDGLSFAQKVVEPWDVSLITCFY